ncbi:MAG TPA: hypothetical protein VND23_09980 [Acidimicrobiales bacterium]|nr:hypothetical protein [Acidimicrobiales bacterium]
MSSLWTPDGEHRVEREPDGAVSGRARSATQAPDEVASDLDEERDREEIADLERQLAEAPPEDVIANHCYGMFQLAALHLGQRPPQLDGARLAIDAFAAVVETLGDRLGSSTGTLRDGLAQIRLAFVQIAGAGHADSDSDDRAAPER